MANPDFDRVAATTLKNYSKQMADNVSNHIPLLGVMKTKGGVKLDGGDTIVLPVLSEFAATQSYSGSDVIPLVKSDGQTAAEYNWKQTITPIIIEGIEKARNAGKSKQIDLMKDLIEQAELSIENKVSEMFFGDGTGNFGKDMLGLEAIISQNPSVGTLGGINAATDTYWRNTANTAVGSFAANGLREIETAIRATQRGTDKVDLLCMDTTNFGRLSSVANGRAEFSNPRLAELGFDGLKVQGIDVIFDANSPADRCYGVNTRWTKFYIHQDNNFVTGKFIEPANQDILVAKVKLYGQLATKRREANFVLSGFTA